MKLSIEELKAFESNPSNNFLTRGQMMEVVRELIAIRETQTVPVAFTGSGSLAAIKGGHEGYIWGNSAEAHPIELYTTPQPAHTEQHGWIKCSEQLPPDDDFVLVWPLPDFGVDLHVGQYMKYHKKGAGWFAQVNEQNYGIECHPISVTHWMKLPAAPKPEM